MNSDSRRTDDKDTLSPSHQATVVEPVDRKTTITGTQGTYELEEQPFATGNYAEVFKAKDSNTGTIRTCKVINLRKPSFPDKKRDEIDEEIDIVCLMQHENIVAFVDQFRTQDQIYIISERVQGTTLAEYCRNNSNYLTERDSRFIFRQICNAVDYMHQHGILHRDIKSENIVIDGDLKIKLIDFGLTQCSTGPEGQTNFSGSTPYLTPEIKGIEANGYKFHVDILSLGILLFRMLVGEYPSSDNLYDNIDKNEGEENHKTDKESGLDSLTHDWRPLVDKQSKRSPEVKHLLETLLEADPSRRARMDQILASDWMRMAEDLLANVDRTEHSGLTCISKSNEESSSIDSPVQVRQEPWGELTIAPGGFPDAPRRIELRDSCHVLGRADDGTVKILLGSHRSISVKHCIIERDGKGVVMMASTSLNGTYINNLHFGKKRSGQLFNGDVLGIVVCEGHLAALPDKSLGCSHCLKYNVILHGVGQTTPEQWARRIYADHKHKGFKKRRQEDRTLDENIPIWGKLVALNVLTQDEELQGEKTTIGRGKDCDIVITNNVISRQHCIIEWVAEDRKAYLTNLGTNRTVVNEEVFEGRLQLRNNDQINLVSSFRGRGKEEIHIGYRLTIRVRDKILSRKRAKNRLENIPEPVLPPDKATSDVVTEETVVDEQTLYGHPHEQLD